MTDDRDAETVTTRTETVSEAPREYTTTTTAAPKRGNGLWLVLGLIAIIAIVALVYMFSQNRTDTTAATDTAFAQGQIAATADQAGDAAANASAAAANAAQSAASATSNAASNAADATANAADNAADAVTTD
ncbi:MAG: hypothetical protein ACXW3D_04245, partial [Caulobacteraceae bacterium]